MRPSLSVKKQLHECVDVTNPLSVSPYLLAKNWQTKEKIA